MYNESETDFSRNYLREILNGISQPPCLMGGWSVYYLVNVRFRQVTGRDYLGSRDIDLGFHIDVKWSKVEFENSAFNRSIAKIKQMGFEAESYRFVKRYHLNERRELTLEEKRRLPQYDTFNLYIDMLVDSDDPRRHQVADFTVLEEPLLKEVFEKNDRVKTGLFGVTVIMPSPQLLIRMKVKSFPLRTQDDKRTKDLADICALLLYSGSNAPILGDRSSIAAYTQAVNKTTDDEWKLIADALGLDAPLARRAAQQILI